MNSDERPFDCWDCTGCLLKEICAKEDEERHSGLLTEEDEE